MTDPLQEFSPATSAWFRSNFAAPTPAQTGAWAAVQAGHHALVVAPTGSGKTLSAFLWALDGLLTTPTPEALRRCRVLYVSPLKALAVDVERNLRAPLVGIRHAAARLGIDVTDVEVAVRSGDTPAEERRRFARHGADILITTPESLFLLLTSQAREALRGVETVILDEVHAVAGTKRGAHLAVTLERLDALLERPATRIGLSATVRPLEEVARYLTGGRPCDVVAPASTKTWELDVVVPVEDMSALPAVEPSPGPRPTSGGGETTEHRERTPQSVWPFVEERIVDLIADHTSTLVFANSRRLAERLTARLNEIWADRLDPDREHPAEAHPPAMVMASGRAEGAPPVLARAHHGSVSREQRQEIEEALKSGRLPAVVATSSLELGIDMGAVDLVIQVEAPPSVASGLQRVGRAGHQVGAVSKGVLFPKFRGDLVATAVVTERMKEGLIEALRIPSNPVDVLAQQVVAMASMDDWAVDDVAALMRRTASFSSLPDSVLEATLDMLSGRYPSDEFAELRPRIVWDRGTDVVSGRPGAQRLAIMSGGTIPDRGLYGVFLASGEGPGRRVGELDEEMVYESRVGDVFALGSSSWRIEDITHDRVLVTPAPGQPARLPFWRGDLVGRPAELGRALGAFVREVGTARPQQARARVARAGLDEWATDNLLAHLDEQRASIPSLPSDTTVVLERFRDEIGDWRVVLHSPYGNQVHAPWALAISARMAERFGIDVDAMASDDGIVLRMPDMGDAEEPVWAHELADVVAVDPDEIIDLVTDQLGGSAVFAARFRECAARALLLPRRNPAKRQPLWQQRQRSAQLLQVASGYPSFPIVLEAVRECLHDVFDVPALADVLRRLRSREIAVVEATTPSPSPFARTLLFGYVGQFLYEGDSPLAERRAAALTLDPTMLAELLGRGEGASLRDLLDADACRQVEAELQFLTPERAARNGEDVADLLRVLGPLAADAVASRSQQPELATDWLAGLVAARRVITVRIRDEERFAAVEDAGRLQHGLGVQLPVGLPSALLEPGPDPLGSLALRFARTHLPFTVDELAAELGVGVAVASRVLDEQVAAGKLTRGDFLPDEIATGGLEHADPDVVRRLRRRSLAALRQEVEATEPRQLARFLPRWQGLHERRRGTDGLAEAVDQLVGARVPASGLESLVLPARVEGYSPAMLDELLASGELVWQGHGSVGRDDGWISLHVADSAGVTLATPDLDHLTEPQHQLLDVLAHGGAHFAPRLASQLGRATDASFADDLWALVWAGAVTGDTLVGLRALVGATSSKARPRAVARTRRHRLGGLAGPLPRPGRAEVIPARLAGRWAAVPAVAEDPTVLAWARADLLLARHGVVTRTAVESEDVPGGFGGVYRVLKQAEEAGRVRRGYFVEGLGASQFATAGAVDRLRAIAPAPTSEMPESPLAHLGQGPHRTEPDAFLLAAADPANPYGAALPWPDSPGPHRPARKAGACVALVDGECVLYVEKGGRTVLALSDDDAALSLAASMLAATVRRGALGTLTVQRINGVDVLAEPSPLAERLEASGFRMTPRGLRLRPEVS